MFLLTLKLIKLQKTGAKVALFARTEFIWGLVCLVVSGFPFCDVLLTRLARNSIRDGSLDASYTLVKQNLPFLLDSPPQRRFSSATLPYPLEPANTFIFSRCSLSICTISATNACPLKLSKHQSPLNPCENISTPRLNRLLPVPGPLEVRNLHRPSLSATPVWVWQRGLDRN